MSLSLPIKVNSLSNQQTKLVLSTRVLRILMIHVLFIETTFIRYFDSILDYKQYFPMPKKSNINAWMIKPQHA